MPLFFYNIRKKVLLSRGFFIMCLSLVIRNFIKSHMCKSFHRYIKRSEQVWHNVSFYVHEQLPYVPRLPLWWPPFVSFCHVRHAYVSESSLASHCRLPSVMYRFAYPLWCPVWWCYRYVVCRALFFFPHAFNINILSLLESNQSVISPLLFKAWVKGKSSRPIVGYHRPPVCGVYPSLLKEINS